ncbi:hypothetical protein E0J02_25840, partial [Rhizobium leguminosarum bv. viciae]
LDPLQVALAHRYQSHPQSPPSSNPGRVTFQLCRNRTLQLCGYTCQSGIMQFMELMSFVAVIDASCQHRASATRSEISRTPRRRRLANWRPAVRRTRHVSTSYVTGFSSRRARGGRRPIWLLEGH